MAPVFDAAVFDPTVFETAGTDLSANGTLSLSGTANLQLEVTFAAAGALALNGSASLLTDITIQANGVLALLTSASLRAAKRAGILSGCGEPLAADCEQWLLKIFKRQE